MDKGHPKTEQGLACANPLNYRGGHGNMVSISMFLCTRSSEPVHELTCLIFNLTRAGSGPRFFLLERHGVRAG